MPFRTASLRLLLAATALLGAGCNVFDESLVPTEGTSNSGLGEDCLDQNLPHFSSLDSFIQIDTSTLRNDRHDLTCVGANAAGNDGFFAVDMLEGQKWHFHVRVTAGTTADPTVYVLDSGCQDSVCQHGWGLNECGPGQDEHFSFFPPGDGQYFVAVDTISTGGEPMEILAVQPECGDNAKQHSESCEDGNLDSGDGCDSLCRKELANGDLEVEPNDEPTANANVLPLESGSAQVSGVIGGKCDFDSFAVAVPENGTLSATIGGDCSFDLSLQLIRPNGFSELETILTSAGECPVITGTESFANGLAEGVYFLRLTTQSEAEPTSLDYTLEVQVTTP